MINAQFPPFGFTVESRVLSRLNARKKKKTRKVGIKRDQTAIQLLRWPFIFPVGVIFGADKETRRRFFSSSPPGFFSLSPCAWAAACQVPFCFFLMLFSYQSRISLYISYRARFRLLPEEYVVSRAVFHCLVSFDPLERRSLSGYPSLHVYDAACLCGVHVRACCDLTDADLVISSGAPLFSLFFFFSYS